MDVVDIAGSVRTLDATHNKLGEFLRGIGCLILNVLACDRSFCVFGVLLKIWGRQSLEEYYFVLFFLEI